MMKRVKTALGAMVCAAMLSSPVLADELAPLPPQNAPDYTKFNGAYVGVHLGYAIGGHQYEYEETVLGSLSQELSLHGAEYGASVGWGRAFGRFYLGAELEASKTDVSSSVEIEVLGLNKDVDVSINYMYGGSLRAGYLVSENALAYVKAGVVNVHIERERTSSWGDGNKRDGWELFPQVGVGMQYLMTDSISLKGEFGGAADGDTIVGLGRVGLAYHF